MLLEPLFYAEMARSNRLCLLAAIYWRHLRHYTLAPPPQVRHKLAILPFMRVPLDFKTIHVNGLGSRAVKRGARRHQHRIRPVSCFNFLLTQRKSFVWCRIVGIQESLSLS